MWFRLLKIEAGDSTKDKVPEPFVSLAKKLDFNL